MTTITCDGCGAKLRKGALRYKVKIDVHAAYDEMRVTLLDLVRDHRAEIKNLIERMKHKDPRELEEKIFKQFQLDLCPACQFAYLQNPLRFHPEQGAVDDELDIEAFLKSLGRSAPGE